MSVCFYPKHEFACPNLSHCPHPGGMALGTLVVIANRSDQSFESSHLTIRGLEERNAELVSKVVSLQAQLDQVKLESKLERQNKFATNKQKQAEAETTSTADEQARSDQPAKKRGAPVGHPGWFRPTATKYNWDIDVQAPNRCPFCNVLATILPNVEPSEHLQEDIIDGDAFGWESIPFNGIKILSPHGIAGMIGPYLFTTVLAGRSYRIPVLTILAPPFALAAAILTVALILAVIVVPRKTNPRVARP